jgi:predicted RNA-binding Zn-ribbon protein involved in translation (DUF1610 family)
MEKAKRVESSAPVVVEPSTPQCHVCHDEFSKKKEFACKNCGEKVCHECSTNRFSSFLLSWKRNKRVCEPCLEKLKVEIAKKAENDPSVKEQADAEIRAAGDLKARISKKKAKQDVSGSSSSDSDTDSHDENGMFYF